ncbi:class I SAM-dependent methyltransferase [Streptantibioticus ferralitis]|uniref:Class I SAM-dependent methyltransferase n=1 Tax=Streptantibioticus ferralitis TaxID=236510 RepID=A0ABT5ZB09_9ACTN|nr:class I SAM-dependent methyltransferase [Streptantibioticus ferralitis]MDF2261019.1 class I SAM-dependent methyltransferase [Streptantibioticus ferralitis]
MAKTFERRDTPAVAARENLLRLRKLAELTLDVKPTAREVLDVGVGFWYSTAVLRCAYPAAEITGLEYPQAPMWQHSAWRNAGKRYADRVIERDSLTAGELPDRYDVVAACEILEHIEPSRLIPLLASWRGILCSGGVLVGTMPNFSCVLNRLLFLTHGGTSMELPQVRPYGTYDHLREYTADEFTRILRLAGYSHSIIRFAARPRAWVRSTRWPRAADLIERGAGALAPRSLGQIVFAARP